METFFKINAGFKKFSYYMTLLAAISLGIMMLLTTIDVLGRYFFNRPIPGSYELIGFSLIIAMGWGLTYCQIQKHHLTATFILEKLSDKAKRIVDVLTYLFGFVLFSIISWQLVQLAGDYISRGATSSTLKIAYAPFVILLIVSTVMLTVAYILDFIDSSLSLIKKR
jgi:TRAP-type transport system small permease protein